MTGIVDRLPACAIPFVTRSLRHGRGRRYAVTSCGFALLLALTTLWIGLSHGEAARSARGELGVELSLSVIEYREFVLIRANRHASSSYTQHMIAVRTVRAALEDVPEQTWQLELQDRARALAKKWAPDPPQARDHRDQYFSWDDPVQVRRLAKIVEHGGVPPIVDYISPVDLRGALEILAMLTGGLLILLLTMVAPLLVALQQASERHQNTLQPLGGTALDVRQLVIGLACGPLAIVVIFAAPLAVLFAGAAVAVGEFDCLLLLPALTCTAIGLVFGAQLLGHLLGARLAPGLIAVGMLCLLGLVGLSGLAVATELDRELGLPAVLPHVGMFALLGDGFGDCWRQAWLSHHGLVLAEVRVEFWVPMVIGVLGASLLGLLALHALTRQVEGRDTLLGPGSLDTASPASQARRPTGFVAMSIVARLPACAIPFVTRSLRRGRGRRYAVMSFGFALLLLLTTLWIGLGRSEAARDARIEIGMELHFWETTVTISGAIAEVPRRASDLELHASARALAKDWDIEPDSSYQFSWDDSIDVQRLAKIVEGGGVGLRGTLELLAILTGGLLILLLTGIAPLLVALQQATEQHENTLLPLTGTALDARQLMLGLACGPLAIVVIFAAPLVVLFAGAAAAVGELDCLLLLPGLVGTAIGLVFGAQLLAHWMGTRLAPWLVAVGCVFVLGFVGLSGLAVATEFDRELLGMPAVLPHVGMLALLGDGFGDCWQGDLLGLHPAGVALGEFWLPMVIGTLGAALLGLLALQALARHVERRDTLLDRRHALFGALICIAMVDVELAWMGASGPIHQGYGLPALAVPFMLLAMARVPISGLAGKPRRLPLARLLGEFGGWTLIHMIVGAALDLGTRGFHPLSLVGIGWCSLIAVLLAVRSAATRGRILGRVWMTACLFILPFIYVAASALAFMPHMLTAMVDTEMKLTAVWMLMLSVVPLILVRRLRKHGVRLSF